MPTTERKKPGPKPAAVTKKVRVLVRFTEREAEMVRAELAKKRLEPSTGIRLITLDSLKIQPDR